MSHNGFYQTMVLYVNHLKLSFSEKIFRRVSVSLPTEKITKEYQEKNNLLDEKKI